MMGRMRTAKNYVKFFYEKYLGRVAIGVGYDDDLSEIYPMVFKNENHESIGIVALGAVPDEEGIVYIYHLGAFELRRGNGSKILKELCDRADKFDVSLKASAIVMPNGKDPSMSTDNLIKWYKRFGFKENNGLLRNPMVRKK
jgi:hypothetical protein